MTQRSNKNSCLLVSFAPWCLNVAATPHTRPQITERRRRATALGSGASPTWPSSSSCHSLPPFPCISFPTLVRQAQSGWPQAGWPLQLWARHIPLSTSTPRIPKCPLIRRDNIPQTQKGGASLPMAVVRKESTSDSFPSL